MFNSLSATHSSGRIVPPCLPPYPITLVADCFMATRHSVIVCRDFDSNLPVRLSPVNVRSLNKKIPAEFSGFRQ